MDLQIKDKVVLITGGAKGIGAAIARACASEGAVPVFVDRDAEAGKQLQSELQSAGKACGQICVDLQVAENCSSAVQRTLRDFGRLDVLVNNAGTNDRVGLEQGSPEKYLVSLQRNLLHYYNMAHYALPALKKSQGCIVNIASKTAFTGQGGTSGYASSKGAILALTREWAVELLPYGIRVNAVVPAEVMTSLYREWLSSLPNPEEKLRQIVSKIPLGKRMTHAEEIAAMALFLISPQAAHITAQFLFVDGGYVHLDRALS
ncbi:MAG TPA: SDR family oxidoreductase [Candidatus Dormibacteraeota bacterium]|nr:SDR family oxidoreductase [Candidatus Dormibacteraeota bacterium]